MFLHDGSLFSLNCKRSNVEIPQYASYEVDPVTRSGGKSLFRDYITPQYYAGLNFAWMGMVPGDVKWNGLLETFADHNVPPSSNEAEAREQFRRLVGSAVDVAA